VESKQEHWDNVFASKSSHEVSWTQDYPKISMQFISDINLPKTAKILEVGGGEGFLVDALLEKGYTNITVIDPDVIKDIVIA
jgi:16S rRNA A1518/A1519 N6-dimethyltransferase RsmA/KsgA/DIM1 with predicted DNA glycosylase/AP lyase activity